MLISEAARFGGPIVAQNFIAASTLFRLEVSP